MWVTIAILPAAIKVISAGDSEAFVDIKLTRDKKHDMPQKFNPFLHL